MNRRVAFALALSLFFAGSIGGHAEAARSKPDLIVYAVSAPSSASPDATIVVSGTVKNQGKASSKSFSVGYYLSTSPSSTTGAAVLGTQNISSLSAGASAALVNSFTVPGSTASGTFYVVAVADSTKVISESNESNNTRASGAIAVQVPESAQMAVWVTDALTRAQPTDPPGMSTATAIRAARNEAEAFQVIVRAPATQALSNVNMVASDLVGPGLIDKSNVTLYREHYIQVTTPSPSSPFPPGWWPDALIPFVNPETGQPLSGGRFPAAPFPVPAGQNQPVWVEVFVPKGTPAGIYSGTVTVTADNASSVPVPMTVTVWGFTLPDNLAMRSDFGSFWGLSGRYNLSWTDYLAMDQLYSNVLLDHRIQVKPASTAPSRAADGTIQVSSANAAALQQWFSRANSYHIGFLPTWPFSDPLGVDRSKAVNYLSSYAQYLQTNGWLQYAYTYPVDEPNSSAVYQQVRDLATLIHGVDSGIKVLTTEQPIPTDLTWGSLIGYVDTWVPLMKNFDPVSIAERLAAGDEAWSYTALKQGAEGIPVWLLDYPLLNYRVTSWINWRYGLKGLLYWDTIYWSEVSDPWSVPGTYVSGGQVYNGEGTLVYPGRELGIGYDGPISSIRLKALRDGAEDYEYLALVRNLGDSAYADQQALQVGGSFTQWSRDPADMAATRENLANRILQLGGQ